MIKFDNLMIRGFYLYFDILKKYLFMELAKFNMLVEERTLYLYFVYIRGLSKKFVKHCDFVISNRFLYTYCMSKYLSFNFNQTVNQRNFDCFPFN